MDAQSGSSSRQWRGPLILGALTLVVVGAVWLRAGRAELVASPSPSPVLPTPSVAGLRFPTVSIPVEATDPVLGDPAAPLLLVEYADFECSYCRQFHQETWPELKQRYIDSGQLKVVFKDFPLSQIHPRAQAAAEAAQCAHQQGKFWEYADQLWQGESALTDADLLRHATTVGVDPTAFSRCVATHATAAQVAQDAQAAIAAGVAGTPAFVLNNQLIEGAITLEEFSRLLVPVTPQP